MPTTMTWPTAGLPAPVLPPSTYNHPKHKSNKCRYCSHSVSRAHDLARHVRAAHSELFECQQCHLTFTVSEHLNQHALETKHEAFKCKEPDCAGTFSRLDDLRRHNRKHQPDTQRWRCPHCPAESKGFSRKDHLTQHLRNFHRMG